MSSKALQEKLIRYSLILLFTVGVGTFGYCVLENYPVFDAIYMTVTTLATVGYGEIIPLHFQGRLFTVVLILCGVGMLLYMLSDIAQLIAHTDPRELFGRARMQGRIEKLRNHHIVCGFGRTGQEVARQFGQDKIPFVLIELDANLSRRAQEEGMLVLEGDATEDNVLKQAQIQYASGIVCSLPDDAANTFIALSAKEFNENIKIVCRAANPGSEAKMLRAGAHKVISPYVIAGRRMATAVRHPLVLEFLDVAMHNPKFDLRLEQIMISSESKLKGISLKDANIKQTVGAMILAVNKGPDLITNPGPDFVFAAGDTLIALGAQDELDKLCELAGVLKT